MTETGTTPPKSHPEYFGDYIPFLSPANIQNNKIISITQGLSKTGLQYGRVVEPGTILQVCIGGSIGKCAITNKVVTFNQQINSITPIFCDITYINSILQSENFRLQIVDSSTGTATPIINRTNWENLLIPIPPIEEQKRLTHKIEALTPFILSFENLADNLNLLNTSIKSKLTKSILQEAIQGKLIPQIESEGTAEELLKEIRSEKKRLVKEGKLKKSALANESRIFRGEDNKYYEQIGSKVLEISEEIPFMIPDNWKLCRLETVFEINPKNEVEDDAECAFIPMEYINAGFGSGFTYQTAKWKSIKRGYTHFADGDIAFAKITPCFQNRKSVILRHLPNGVGAGTTELKVLRPYLRTIQPEYVLFFLQSPYFIDEAIFKGTANQQRVITGYVERKLFPLPPIEEQKRIVAQIEKLFEQLS